MTPTPNTPLTAEDVTLLKGGDLLRVVDPHPGTHKVGDVVAVLNTVPVSSTEDWVRIEVDGFPVEQYPHRFTFIGRPGPDGWIAAPEGGWTENPVPGQRVEWKSKAFTGTGDADLLNWSRNHLMPIIAFRLASLSPAASEPGGESGAALADAGREAIRKVIHEVWQLLDDGETGPDGSVTIDQARYQEVSKAMDELEALVPDSVGPFWGGFPVNYFWGLK